MLKPEWRMVHDLFSPEGCMVHGLLNPEGCMVHGLLNPEGCMYGRPTWRGKTRPDRHWVEPFFAIAFVLLYSCYIFCQIVYKDFLHSAKIGLPRRLNQGINECSAVFEKHQPTFMRMGSEQCIGSTPCSPMVSVVSVKIIPCPGLYILLSHSISLR